MTFHVKAGPGADGATVVVAAPGGLRDAKPKSRSEVEIRFAQVQESDVPTDAGPAVRPLHAKSLWLENDKWICHTVGSSNFTGAGLGLADAPNVEANLAYFVARDRDPGLARRLEQVWPMHEYLDDSTLAFAPEPDETEGTEAQILPDFFQSATLRAVRPGELSLDLQFSPSAKPPPKWVIFVEGEKVPLLDEAAWIKKGQPTTASLAWPADLRPPTGLEVSLEEAAGRAWWPVNVWDFSALPPPEELRSLTLDALIDILTSAKPLREAMREWLRRRARAAMSGSSNAQVPELDPLRRVDTSAFVLQRTRRISWALRGLRDRLERPAATEDALNWRLGGPVGASAVARAIERECGPRSADEHAFALAEAGTRIDSRPARRCAGVSQRRGSARARSGFARELAPAAKAAAINASPPTRKYVEGALTELA